MATMRKRSAMIFSLLSAIAVLSRESRLRRLMVEGMILGVRGATPVAMFILFRNVWMNIGPRHFHPKILMKYGLISWSLAETVFFFYIWQCTRFLNTQTTRRWRAVNVHSTEERRKASMERYLQMLAQVCRGGGNSSGSNGDAPSGTSALRRGLDRSGKAGQKSNGTLGIRTRSSAALARSGSFLGLGAAVKQEESVEDLLKHIEGSNGNLEEELQRLRWHELATFFHGPGRGDADNILSWLRRDNVQEWIAHYWFRGATPDELREDSPEQFQELRCLAELVLQTAGLLAMREGRNPDVKTYRVFSDPLPVVHRPLFVYAGTSLLCPLLSYQVMQWLGFHRERSGGLTYWKRPRRGDVDPRLDVSAPRQEPLVFVHGLGVGLVPYFVFIYRLSQRHSGELFVPEFPFLAMAPWESVPSAREVVAQLQDMLAAHGHRAAHWHGHSFGCVVIGWVMKMSPSSVVYATLMEPAQFLVIKAEALTKVLWGEAATTFEILIRYFAFRELFTVNLLCRNFFWEQSSMWPEDLKVPTIVTLGADDHIVQSTFVKRLLEHEKAARKLQRRLNSKQKRIPTSGSSTDVRVDTLQQAASANKSQGSEALEILWCEGFFHGRILMDWRANERLFNRMRTLVRTEG